MEGAGLTDLSPELLASVLASAPLDVQDLARAAGTCRAWRQTVEQHQGRVYGAAYERTFLADEPPPTSQLCSNVMGCAVAQLTEGDEAGLAARLARRLAPGDQRGLFRRRLELDRNWASGTSSAVELRPAHRDYLRCCQLAGDTLLTASGSVALRDCSLGVWDLASGRLRHWLRGHEAPIWCASMAEPLGLAASASQDGTLRLWDLHSGAGALLLRGGPPMHTLHLHAPSRQLVAGDDAGNSHWWRDPALPAPGAAPPRAETFAAFPGRRVGCIQAQQGLVACACDSAGPLGDVVLLRPPDQGDAAGGAAAGSCGLGLLARLADPTVAGVQALCLHGGLLAAASGRSVVLFDIASQRKLFSVRHLDEIYCMQMSGGRRLVTGGADGQVVAWDVRTGLPEWRAQHHAPLHALAHDGRHLAVGDWSGAVSVYDVRTGRLLAAFEQHDERVWAVAVCGLAVVSAGLDERVVVRSFEPDAFRGAGWAGMPRLPM